MDVLKDMKAKGVWLVPTIVVTQPGALEFYRKIGSPPWYLERVKITGADHWEMLQNAIRLGVKIALGTDQFPFEPNDGTTATIAEAETVREGRHDAVASAAGGRPRRPQPCCGWMRDLGSIARGKLADIDALEADPLKDIHALRTSGFRDEGRRRVPGRPESVPGAVDGAEGCEDRLMTPVFRVVALPALLAIAALPSGTRALDASGTPAAGAPVSAVAAEERDLNALYDSYWQDWLALNPQLALNQGVTRSEAQFDDSLEDSWLQRVRSMLERYRTALKRFDPGPLPEEARISYDMLSYELEQALSYYGSDLYDTASRVESLGGSAPHSRRAHRFEVLATPVSVW